MTFCIIHKISTAQKYWFFSNAENVFPTGIFSFFTTLILTFSSQFLKHVISIRSAKTAQIAIVFTHAAWSSPNNLTSGVVNVTAMILPIGEVPYERYLTYLFLWKILSSSQINFRMEDSTLYSRPLL